MASFIEFISQELSAPFLIVHIFDQRVLDRHASPRGQEVGARSIQKLTDLPTRVNRDQLIAQVIIGSVKGHREGNGHPLPRELLNRGHEANRRHGDVTGAHTEPLGGRVNEAMQGADHSLVVRQRLTHAHKNHVRQVSRPTRQLAITARGLGLAYLIDDLGRREITSEAHLPRRAERTRHTAARLRRDTQRRTLRVTHEHRLHLRTVIETPQVLDRAATVSLQRHDLRHEVRQQGL